MTLKGKREKGQAATLPMGDAVKAAIEKAMATIKPYFARVTPYWDALPKPHRIGVSALAGLLVVLLLWPSSDDNAAVPETTANGERVALPLTFENQDPAEDDGFNQNGSGGGVYPNGVTEKCQYTTKREYGLGELRSGAGRYLVEYIQTARPAFA
ncbi:OapA N-terminal domain-containing protein [Enterovibrio sp. Hal110]